MTDKRRPGDPFPFVANAQRGETFAESAATTNRLLSELWEIGGRECYDQDLLNFGLTKAEARIDDGTLRPGDFPVGRTGPSPFAEPR
jgi:hypothetical protein